MSYSIVKHRRGTTQEWLDLNIVPQAGELIIEECLTGIRKCKIGDGVSRFSDLPYLGDDITKNLLTKMDEAEQRSCIYTDNAFQKAEAKINELSTRSAAELAQAVERVINLYIEADESVCAEVATLLAKEAELRHAEISSTAHDIQSRVTTKLELATDQLHTEIAEAKAASIATATEVVNDVKKSLSTDISSSENRVLDHLSSLSEDLSQQVSTVDAKIDAVSTSFDNKIEDTTTAIRTELGTAVADLKQNHAADSQALTSMLANQLTTAKSELSSEIAKNAESISTVETALSKTFDDKLSQTEDSLRTTIRSGDEVNAKAIVNARLDLEVAITDTAKQAADNLDAVKTNLESVDALLKAQLASASTVHAADIKEINDKITALQEKATSLTSADVLQIEQIATVRNTLASDISQLTAEMRDIVKSIQNSIDVLTTRVATEEVTRQSNDAIIEQQLTTDVSRIDAKILDMVQDDIDAIESIAAVNNTLTLAIKTLQSTSNENFRAHKAELDSFKVTLQLNYADILNRLDIVAKDANTTDNAIRLEVEEVAANVEDARKAIEANTEDISIQAKRISTLASLRHGSTTGDAELIDIRTGYDGIVHESAGDAVRAVGNDLTDLKRRLPDFIPANSVDGLLYEDNQLYLMSGDKTVGEPVTITGGAGGTGSFSKVTVTNNLASNSLVVAKGNEVTIDFTYTSVENEVPTGDGTVNIYINSKKIDKLAGVVVQGVRNTREVSSYLKDGSNTVKVTCTDQFGSSRSLSYSIFILDLKIESSFNSEVQYSGQILFRYKVYGEIEKTAHVLVDGVEVSKVTLAKDVNGRDTTYTIAKQAHGCHTIKAYVTARTDSGEVTSNILEYDIICTEPDKNEAILASVYTTKKATQGDLIAIPYMLYDPTKVDCAVDLIVSTQVAGVTTEVSRTPVVVDRGLQTWSTRKYPVGKVVFTISYTYILYGIEQTITKSHTVDVDALEVDITADTDSLQLHLSAAGRSNTEVNPAIWEFTPTKTNAEETVETITTTFKNFNWKSNGWVVDDSGDTCLRLTGDARAIINFKPFVPDTATSGFKAFGKTIEFEYSVRDVNSRDTVVIDCMNMYDNDGKVTLTNAHGFLATPDTAYLQSAGTKVSCRYKDEERIRVAVSVDYADSLTRFVSIYLDGVLSGVQRYETNDTFSQTNPVNITLGSNSCGLDIYSIRIYNKSLTAAQMLQNYIADKADPTEKLALLTDNDLLVGDVISYDRVKALGKIPIVTFTGPMPTYKGDKKKGTTRMKFEDPDHPELNFDVLIKELDVQGTSSQFYARKNWKIKLENAISHMRGAIPAKVFCIKVDYAEATGTHNTGVANYVETLYDRNEVTLPPQKDDTRVRTTIQGFPCVLFEKETEDSTPVFSSKGNFNYDKGAENAFGFTEDYESFGVECWEFCNNTSDSCNFAGEIPANWKDDFEPRYVPESAGFDRIEELLEIQELAAKGEAVMTDAERTELTNLQRSCITNFKAMHDWVLSTATYTLQDGNRIPIVPKPLAQAVTYGTTTYTMDDENYRLAKFKHEFANYFNMHYSSIYYVFTFVALMADQRAKNMFLTRWKDTDGKYRWYPYFYDNDTIFGINNEGKLVFDYFHEDTDQLGSSNIYTGQNSVLWNNFRACFQREIKETYANLRSSKKLTYDKLIEQFVTKGSDEWSAAIYNADAEYKYLSMARQVTADGDVDASNLYQVRGTGEQHLRYFIANRLKYCDSKWNAGDYPSDEIFLRIYTPVQKAITEDMSEETKAEIQAHNARIAASLEAVPANPNITVIPFSDMYAGVKYKANGTLQQYRLKAGESHTFGPVNENETFSDTETAIYGAGEISSLGDLSGLYIGVINLSKASKLKILKIGDADPRYYNDNFYGITVGSNRLLRSIDLRNCFGLGLSHEKDTAPQQTLALGGCPNIEEIYTEGTNLTSVDLPESGYIKVLHLPASTTVLNIRNQPYITDFSVATENGIKYKNVRTLRIENCPTLNTNEILSDILTVCRATAPYEAPRVRLTGINWSYPDTTFVKSLFPTFDASGIITGGIRGLDADNNDLADAYLVGTCHINKLSGADYAVIKDRYKTLEITFDEMSSVIKFKRPVIQLEDGKFVHKGYTEFSDTVKGIDSSMPTYEDPIAAGKFDTPVWPENDAFKYEFVGWSRKEQPYLGVDDHEDNYTKYIQADALWSIAGDRILYPVFKALRKSYKVTFKNMTDVPENQVLEVVDTPYGANATYSKQTPQKLDAAKPSLYEFTGWLPKPENITGPLECKAQFALLDSSWYKIQPGDISDCTDYWGNIFDGYTLFEDTKTMAITQCDNDLNPATEITPTMTFNDVAYEVVTVGGFSDHRGLELIKLPNTVKTISARAFYNCYNLFEVTIPESVQEIGMYAFQSCGRLSEVRLPAAVIRIGDGAFADCKKLIKIDASANDHFYVNNTGCLIELATKELIQGGLTANTISLPQEGEIVALRPYCFSNTIIKEAIIPNGVTKIPSNAFSRCEQLDTVFLPEGIVELDATCFAWCYRLTEVLLPSTLRIIKTYVFNGCSFTEVEIPAKTSSLLERSFGELRQLTRVKFNANYDSDGSLLVPYIHEAAFADSGAEEGLIIECPWPADSTPQAPWGAKYATVEFADQTITYS